MEITSVTYNNMNPKSFLSSKTVWFGLAQIAFGGVGLVTGWVDQQTAFALIVTGFGSLGFRVVTKQPIV